MYFYIYDHFLNDRKWHDTLAGMEQKLAVLDVKGPTQRIHPFTKMDALVKRAISRGANTIVAVGNDETLLSLINCIPKKVTCGFINVEKESLFSHMLYTHTIDECIEAIAARKHVTINAGRVEKTLFLQRVDIAATTFTAVINDDLVLKVKYPQTLFTILNPQLTYDIHKTSGVLDCTISEMKHGFLSSIKKNPPQDTSKFFIKKLIIKSQKEMPVTIDGIQKAALKTFTVSVVPRACELITGRSIKQKD